MNIEVHYAKKKWIPSMHKALGEVAREERYLEMVTAPPFESVCDYQSRLIDRDLPVYYAVTDHKEVVGWIDVGISEKTRLAHRGGIGMGILEAYRGRGIGSRLMERAIDHSKRVGIEKLELSVYTTNLAGIALYKKFGFETEGYIRAYRKYKGVVYDTIEMAKFL